VVRSWQGLVGHRAGQGLRGLGGGAATSSVSGYSQPSEHGELAGSSDWLYNYIVDLLGEALSYLPISMDVTAGTFQTLVELPSAEGSFRGLSPVLSGHPCFVCKYQSLSPRWTFVSVAVTPLGQGQLFGG
jgi:hypothetical protein